MDDYSSLPMTPEQALTFLSGPDAIMETKVEDAIRVYLEANLSSTDVAIDALAQGYCANAQVCNMMCDWLAALGDDPINLSKKSKNKEHDRSKTSPPKSPTKKFDDKTFEPCDGRLEAAKCIEDTLAGLITKYFSPEMADKIFEDGGVIDWLPELIAHRRWRSFLYELIEQFPHCLMLNFAVKLISDAGFQTEISNVNTAAQQLDIFSRVLLTSIDAVLEEHKKGFPTTAYEKAFGELVRVVCQSEHTYVYALALLKMVGKSEKGWISAACEQMSEALRARLLGREHETTALRTAISQIADDQVATHVVQALLTMTSKGELNPADITIIYDQFIMPHPPPIEVIRDVVLEDLLLDALFHCDGPKVVVEHRDKYVFLLAYIASVTETVNKNGQRTQIRLELDACRQSLDRTVCLLESSDDLLGELSDLIHAVRMPIVAAGVLYYVKSLLLSDARLGDPPSAALCLLDHISTLHPSLHSRTFVVCCQLYEKISRDADAAEVIMERQRSVVDRFVHLLSVGAAIPVLEKISSMFREAHIDASLVRYFAVEVLEIVCPPYSADIVSLLLPLVADNEIFDRGMQEKVPAAGEFLQHCEQFLPLSQVK